MSLFVQGANLPTVEGDKSIKAEIRCIGGKWEFGIMTGGYYCCQEWTFYPLSELPPHGRCIDADAMLMRINHEVMEAYMDGVCYGVHPSQEYLYLLGEIIDDAPTIIPAEEGV